MTTCIKAKLKYKDSQKKKHFNNYRVTYQKIKRYQTVRNLQEASLILWGLTELKILIAYIGLPVYSYYLKLVAKCQKFGRTDL